MPSPTGDTAAPLGFGVWARFESGLWYQAEERLGSVMLWDADLDGRLEVLGPSTQADGVWWEVPEEPGYHLVTADAAGVLPALSGNTAWRGDMDGDGDEDAIVQYTVPLVGRVTEIVYAPVSEGLRRTILAPEADVRGCVADFDGDGHLDILGHNWSSRLGIHWGPILPGEATVGSDDLAAFGRTVGNATCGDVNLDGVADLLAPSTLTLNELRVALGPFPRGETADDEPEWPSRVVNKPSYGPPVVLHGADGTPRVLVMYSAHTVFEGDEVLWIGLPLDLDQPTVLAAVKAEDFGTVGLSNVGDVDGDGVEDVMVDHHFGLNRMWVYSGVASGRLDQEYDALVHHTFEAPSGGFDGADVNGDGRSDILTFGVLDGVARLYLNGPAGLVPPEPPDTGW